MMIAATMRKNAIEMSTTCGGIISLAGGIVMVVSSPFPCRIVKTRSDGAGTGGACICAAA
jgi:hypothetical protein